VERKRRYWEKRAANRAVQVLRQERDTVLRAIRNSTRATMEEAAMKAVDRTPWPAFYNWLYSNVMEEFSRMTITGFKESKQIDQEIVEAFEAFMEDATALREREVKETSKKRLRELILAALAAGLTLSYIQEQIEELYYRDIPIRSKAIGETETITAGNAGSFFTAEFLGAVTKVWVAVLDDRTRPSHREIHGESRYLDQLYSNGLRFPGDPLGASVETINCRCVETYNIL